MVITSLLVRTVSPVAGVFDNRQTHLMGERDCVVAAVVVDLRGISSTVLFKVEAAL